MADQVFVRFVPKNRQTQSRMIAFETALAPAVAQAFTPDLKQAQRAQVELASRSVSTVKTPENRLEATLSRQQFTDLFGVPVVSVPSAAWAAPNSADRMTK